MLSENASRLTAVTFSLRAERSAVSGAHGDRRINDFVCETFLHRQQVHSVWSSLQLCEPEFQTRKMRYVQWWAKCNLIACMCQLANFWLYPGCISGIDSQDWITANVRKSTSINGGLLWLVVWQESLVLSVPRAPAIYRAWRFTVRKTALIRLWLPKKNTKQPRFYVRSVSFECRFQRFFCVVEQGLYFTYCSSNDQKEVNHLTLTGFKNGTAASLASIILRCNETCLIIHNLPLR